MRDEEPLGLFFVPRMPREIHMIRHVARGLGAAINNLHQGGQMGFLGDGTTYAVLPAGTWAQIGQRRVINGGCTDISKRRVGVCFEDVFGYPLNVDPRTFHGLGLCKSNKNFTHDGIEIQLPIAEPEIGKVYTVLVDNISRAGFVRDMRVVVVGGEIPFVVLKERALAERFGMSISNVALVEPLDVLSRAEMANILRFCVAMRFEFGELDVLRDRKTDQIFVVDANRCAEGPCRVLQMPDAERLIHRVCEALVRQFELEDLLGRRCAVSPQNIRDSLLDMRRMTRARSGA